MLWRALPLVAVLPYAFAFAWLYRHLGPGAESFATVVVLYAAGQSGLVVGLAAAGLCMTLHWLVGQTLLGIPGETWLQGGPLATALGLFLVGAVVGRLRDLRVQLGVEMAARQATELRLREAQAAAEAANRAKSEFLARMSHEIRTPMHGVLGVAQVLGETRLTPDQQQYLEMIRGSGELLLAVINDILDFSKIEAGRLELDPAEFELVPLLGETLALVALAARQKGLTAALDLAPDLPGVLVGDAVRLRQVIINLLGNATKFTERGGIVLRVRSAPSAAGQVRLDFEVQDSGIGMKPEVISRIFEAFAQADASTTRVYGGTGLGLSISSQLVRLMGGELRCSSVPGEGSRFFFTLELPLADERLPPAPLVQPAARSEPIVGRVLVAEDNRINQVIAERLLQALGVTVDVVADGAAAVAAAGRCVYDVILLDCQMPVLDGYEAARQIRGAEPPGRRVPMLAVTASVIPEDHARARAAGVDSVLLKPLQADELRQAVLRHLPRARRQSRAFALQSGVTELPLLDVAALADLKRAGGVQVVHTVVGLFEEAAAETRQELRAAATDRAVLGQLAHRQRGTAACVGARRLAASLAQLEALARSGTDEEIAAALGRIEHETEAASRALDRFRNADSAAFVVE